MRLSVFAVLVASSLAPVSAFDEAGIIQLTHFDNVTSTGKNCVPKDFNATAHSHDRYFALLRSGETAVVASYVGTYNASARAMTAEVNDKNKNITLIRSAHHTIRVSVQQEDGVCDYTTKVVAGSVLGLNGTANVTESGLLTVTDLVRSADLAACDHIAEDINNATYAFVRTANLTVMGGLWAHGATPLKRKAADEVSYQVTAADGKVTVHADGGKNETVRAAGGCGFETKVVGGTVMGVVGDSATNISANLRGSNKMVCRTTCTRRVCRQVCRDYWR